MKETHRTQEKYTDRSISRNVQICPHSERHLQSFDFNLHLG